MVAMENDEGVGCRTQSTHPLICGCQHKLGRKFTAFAPPSPTGEVAGPSLTTSGINLTWVRGFTDGSCQLSCLPPFSRHWFRRQEVLEVNISH